MDQQWVLTCGQGYISYSQGVGVKIVPKLQNATIVTNERKKQIGDQIYFLASKRYQDVHWEQVDIELTKNRVQSEEESKSDFIMVESIEEVREKIHQISAWREFIKRYHRCKINLDGSSIVHSLLDKVIFLQKKSGPFIPQGISIGTDKTVFINTNFGEILVRNKEGYLFVNASEQFVVTEKMIMKNYDSLCEPFIEALE